MNERIKELVRQAGGFVDLNQYVGGEKGCMVYTYDGLEKFAELIVRECVEQIINRERSDGEWYQDDIFKHFGVEE